MTDGLTWSLEESGATHRFVMRGEITEEADFSGVVAAATERVVLNLSEVQRINSCGVREWIGFLQRLSSKATKVELERCSPVMVRQLSMIATMRGDAAVTSILVPYFCEACDDERTLPLELQPGRRPTLDECAPCPECGGEMQLDDTPESYLAFVDESAGRTST